MELESEEAKELSRIVHDLRGAAWVMRGFLDLLVSNWDSFEDPRRQEMVKQAYDSGARVMKALEELDGWRGPRQTS